MPIWYRLTPINLNHGSWQRSKVRDQFVIVYANDCNHARARTAVATDDGPPGLVPEDPTGRYSRLVPQKSPWELDEVASCQPDPAPPNHVDADHVICEDGTKVSVPWSPW